MGSRKKKKVARRPGAQVEEHLSGCFLRTAEIDKTTEILNEARDAVIMARAALNLEREKNSQLRQLITELMERGVTEELKTRAIVLTGETDGRESSIH